MRGFTIDKMGRNTSPVKEEDEKEMPMEPKKDNEKPLHILEKKQEETKAPEKADFLGHTNHIAKKEMKKKDKK